MTPLVAELNASSVTNCSGATLEWLLSCDTIQSMACVALEAWILRQFILGFVGFSVSKEKRDGKRK